VQTRPARVSQRESGSRARNSNSDASREVNDLRRAKAEIDSGTVKRITHTQKKRGGGGKTNIGMSVGKAISTSKAKSQTVEKGVGNEGSN